MDLIYWPHRLMWASSHFNDAPLCWWAIVYHSQISMSADCRVGEGRHWKDMDGYPTREAVPPTTLPFPSPCYPVPSPPSPLRDETMWVKSSTAVIFPYSRFNDKVFPPHFRPNVLHPAIFTSVPPLLLTVPRLQLLPLVDLCGGWKWAEGHRWK